MKIEMAANTLLFDFTVDPKDVKNDSQLTLLSANIENILRDHLRNLKLVNTLPTEEGGIFKLYTSELGGIVSLRIFGNGLITINVEYYKGEEQEPIMTFEKCKDLEQEVCERVPGIIASTCFVPIKRGFHGRYYPTSDERLLEYDIDSIIFEERSPFQKVQIVHSRSLGNMLVLDDLQNISEADQIYTDTIMNKGKDSYKDKEIAILGGGDGALLYELLKEKPKSVLMLEIDDVVIRACAQHMRSICGDVLDKKTDTNYQIIIGDCMDSLDQFIKEGRKFDYIFGDLTDVPITDTPSGEMWTFVKKILDVSFKLLKPTGKFMTHGNGASCKDALKMYEDYLDSLEPAVEFQKTKAFIPSFLEDWVFYYINFVQKA